MISKKNICGNYHRLCNYDNENDSCKNKETCGQNCDCKASPKPPIFQNFSYACKGGGMCALEHTEPGNHNNVSYYPNMDECRKVCNKSSQPVKVRSNDGGVGIR
jgi:hypothetical protein